MVGDNSIAPRRLSSSRASMSSDAVCSLQPGSFAFSGHFAVSVVLPLPPWPPKKAPKCIWLPRNPNLSRLTCVPSIVRSRSSFSLRSFSCRFFRASAFFRSCSFLLLLDIGERLLGTRLVGRFRLFNCLALDYRPGLRFRHRPWHGSDKAMTEEMKSSCSASGNHNNPPANPEAQQLREG
ncbi:hypothetical protein KC338_g277 [Hortaea werneckii]|nr:hypothetical protein KC338_g277 [Hortaea werneckii]